MRFDSPSRTGMAGDDLLAAARAGEHPGVLARLRSGFATLGTTQFLPGHCVLLADADVEHLADLSRPARAQFLSDLGLLGEALQVACAACDPAFARLDVEIIGNRWRQLHAHLFPRYTWEPDQVRDGSVWRHPPQRWTDPAHAPGPAHDRLIDAITRELSRVLAEAY